MLRREKVEGVRAVAPGVLGSHGAAAFSIDLNRSATRRIKAIYAHTPRIRSVAPKGADIRPSADSKTGSIDLLNPKRVAMNLPSRHHRETLILDSRISKEVLDQ
jgi:hypothetical protein